jgi:hypothetical protein
MKKIYLLLSFCLLNLFTDAQTVPSYVPTNGLVGWWPFNGNANDESGNGNHGTVLPGVTLGSDRNNNQNSSYLFDGFDGTNKGILLPLNINSNNFTFSMWFQCTDTIKSGQNSSQTIFSLNSALPVNFGVAFNHPYASNNLMGCIISTCYYPNPISWTLSNKLSWHFLSVKKTMNHFEYYIDGSMKLSYDINESFPSTLSLLNIGAISWASGEVFRGNIDDISVYNRELTPQEITALYQGCIANITSQPSNQSTTTGSNTNFHVGFTNTCNTPTNYQWQTNTGFGWQTLQNAGQYTGVNTATLNVSNVNLANTNQLFRCIVSTGNLSDTTQTATLTVVNTNNTNLSGVTHAIPYQAVVRDGSGTPLVNHPLIVRCTLHDSNASGTIIYQETHNITTNTLGLFTLHIGTGTPSMGNIDSIHWALYKKFLQVEFDTTAQGGNYVDLGTQQLMAVPYALYAETAGNALNGPKGDKGDAGVNGMNGVDGATGPAGPQGPQGIAGTFPNGTAAGEMMYWNGNAWVSVAPGGEGQLLSYHNGAPHWENFIAVGLPFRGGIIAYVFKPGDPGYDANVPHGLIAAPNDQIDSKWGCYGILSGANGINIGTGPLNTLTILNNCTELDIAAKICNDLVINGYSDWYLPSIDELNKLFINKQSIGGFTNGRYWSSTEYNIYFPWYLDFDTGNPVWGNNKNNIYHVRAIRSF